jgi:hypothetical protein
MSCFTTIHKILGIYICHHAMSLTGYAERILSLHTSLASLTLTLAITHALLNLVLLTPSFSLSIFRGGQKELNVLFFAPFLTVTQHDGWLAASMLFVS